MSCFISIPDFSPTVTGYTLGIEWNESTKSNQLSQDQTEVHFQTSGNWIWRDTFKEIEIVVSMNDEWHTSYGIEQPG